MLEYGKNGGLGATVFNWLNDDGKMNQASGRRVDSPGIPASPRSEVQNTFLRALTGAGTVG
jgi:hypothetical protein